MNFQEAAEALAAANRAEAGEAPEQAPATAPQGSTGAAGQAQNQPTQDSLFESVNPDELPEELQRFAKQLQADYTRKTQALAEKAKAYEALQGIDPVFARQASEFYMALNSDPNVAREVYQQLEAVLSERGLLEEDDDFGLDDDLDDFGDEGDSRIQKLEQRLQTYEQRQAVLENIHILQRQEAAIREQHPEYKENDIRRIYDLAYAHGGDLLMAEQTYSEMRQGIIAEYMQQKSDIPEGIQHVPATAPAVQPREIKNVDDAHAAALEYLRNRIE